MNEVKVINLGDMFGQMVSEMDFKSSRPLWSAVIDDLQTRAQGWHDFVPEAFQPGDIVMGREGYSIQTHPSFEEPGIVMQVLDEPLHIPDGASHGGAGDRNTVIVAVVVNGAFCMFATDPRRLVKHPGWTDDERFTPAA